MVVSSQISRGLEHNVDKFVTISTCSEPLESHLISFVESRIVSCIKVNHEVTHQSMGMTESTDPVSSILSANKEITKEASELVRKLLPTGLSGTRGVRFYDILDSPMWKHNSLFYEINRKKMEANIVDRRHFMNFKERALALKFRIHRQM